MTKESIESSPSNLEQFLVMLSSNTADKLDSKVVEAINLLGEAEFEGLTGAISVTLANH